MTKPVWRASLIEALTMSCAEIEERRLKYEALSDAEYQRLVETQMQQNTVDWSETDEHIRQTVARVEHKGTQLDWVRPRAAWRTAEKDRLTAQAEQIGALICERDQLRRENAELEAKNEALIGSLSAAVLRPKVPQDSLSPFPANALKHSR